jgi:hypothetical protein
MSAERRAEIRAKTIVVRDRLARISGAEGPIKLLAEAFGCIHALAEAVELLLDETKERS